MPLIESPMTVKTPAQEPPSADCVGAAGPAAAVLADILPLHRKDYQIAHGNGAQ